MTRFRVYLVTGAETVVEVEAEDGDSAVEIALGGDIDLPYAPGFSKFTLGDWTVPSELYSWAAPDEDYEEIDD